MCLSVVVNDCNLLTFRFTNKRSETIAISLFVASIYILYIFIPLNGILNLRLYLSDSVSSEAEISHLRHVQPEQCGTIANVKQCVIFMIRVNFLTNLLLLLCTSSSVKPPY